MLERFDFCIPFTCKGLYLYLALALESFYLKRRQASSQDFLWVGKGVATEAKVDQSIEMKKKKNRKNARGCLAEILRKKKTCLHSLG